MARDVVTDSFTAEVVERSRQTPVLVDFWAPWCGPCRVVGPVLEELERDDGAGWDLAKVDVQSHPEIGTKYGISSIPAIKLFVDGTVVAEMVGALPKSQLRRWLDAHLPGRGAARVEAVRVALAEGRIDEARRLVSELDGKAAGAARLAIEAAGVDPGAEGTAGRYARAVLAAAAARYADALAELLDIVRTDRKFGDDAARKRMLEVFEALGHQDPLVREWRGKLASVLY